MAENTYPYAVARIRVLEKNLLSKQILNNMADAKNADDALKVLKDAGYGDSTEKTDVYEYENLLVNEAKKTYSLMEELLPNENIFGIFLYKNDYHNLKVLLKQEVSGVDGSKYLSYNGTIDIDTLKRCMLDRNFSEISETMADAVKEALEAYSRTQNGQIIDIILDRAVYKSMLEAAKDSKNEFVLKLVQIMCDITNLKTFLRIRRMKKSFSLFLDAYLEFGTIDIDLFSEAFKAEHPENNFYSTVYGNLCEQGFSQSFTEFEKLCDNFQIEYIKKAKYISLTIEPLIAYVFAKESEIKMARIIMTSKLNKIDTEIIKERLRESYV